MSTLLDTKKAANVERNRTILKCVLDAVIYCVCGVGGVGGVGEGEGLGLGSGRVGWCYVCVSCKSIVCVYITDPCICIVC